MVNMQTDARVQKVNRTIVSFKMTFTSLAD